MLKITRKRRESGNESDKKSLKRDIKLWLAVGQLVEQFFMNHRVNGCVLQQDTQPPVPCNSLYICIYQITKYECKMYCKCKSKTSRLQKMQNN